MPNASVQMTTTCGGSIVDIRQHLSVDAGNEPAFFCCPFCKKKFPTLNYLFQHFRTVAMRKVFDHDHVVAGIVNHLGWEHRPMVTQPESSNAKDNLAGSTKPYLDALGVKAPIATRALESRHRKRKAQDREVYRASQDPLLLVQRNPLPRTELSIKNEDCKVEGQLTRLTYEDTDISDWEPNGSDYIDEAVPVSEDHEESLRMSDADIVEPVVSERNKCRCPLHHCQKSFNIAELWQHITARKHRKGKEGRQLINCLLNLPADLRVYSGRLHLKKVKRQATAKRAERVVEFLCPVCGIICDSPDQVFKHWSDEIVERGASQRHIVVFHHLKAKLGLV